MYKLYSNGRNLLVVCDRELKKSDGVYMVWG